MAHEILSVKLYELEKKIEQLCGRIQISESASHDRIKAETETLRREYAENALILRNRLTFSKASAVAKLSEAYVRVEQIIKKTKEEIGNSMTEECSGSIPVEEKILLAEYALDFAMQVSNHALLIAMEAIDAQMTQQEKDSLDKD